MDDFSLTSDNLKQRILAHQLNTGDYEAGKEVETKVKRFRLVVFCIPVRRIPMVRKGWTKMDVPDGWVQSIRGPGPRSVQWPSAGRQEVPMRGQSAVSKPQEKVPKQPTPKGNPVESKIGRIEAALKVLGQEHSDARSCLEDVLKKAKAEGVSREV